jgi:hypothetical protein
MGLPSVLKTWQFFLMFLMPLLSEKGGESDQAARFLPAFGGAMSGMHDSDV